MRYVCSICGYVYDEADNVPFADLPDDWKCPLCGASKADFVPEGAAPSPVSGEAAVQEAADIRPLTSLETSILCSNLIVYPIDGQEFAQPR